MVVPPAIGGALPPPSASLKPAPQSRMNGIIPNSQPPMIPYSARKSQPLDMKLVERKGDAGSRDPPRRNRPHGLMEAPTFRPTEAEFRDPMEYIRSISAKASKYGICKIIPPDSWDPGFAIDLEKFHFRTRRQELNAVEGGTRANMNYLDQLAKFHKQYGTHLNRFPSVDKRPLDLYKLKKAVEVRGGLDKVCKDKKWAEIGRDLGYSGKIMSSLSTSLKNSYQRWLHPYEEYLRLAKPGVHQQLESEYGGPYSPPNTHSPAPRTTQQHTIPAVAPSESVDTPAKRASASLNSATGSHYDILPPPLTSAPPVETPQPVPVFGFTAVNNTSGFAAVNAPSGFVAVNHAPTPEAKRPYVINPLPNGQAQTYSADYGHLAAPFVPTERRADANSHGGQMLKRAMSHDSLNGESGSDGINGDGDGLSGRRSKRVKKDSTPAAMGSYMSVMNPPTPHVRARLGARKQGEKCEQCDKTEDKANIMVCDSCELGYHKYCLDPPLAAFPDYEWHCSKCLVGTGEYGFEEGGIYSLKVFQEKAKNFKEHHFASKMPFDPVTNMPKRPTEDDVEREFWRLVETLTETVEVEYGADIHSTTHGSGFPTIEKDPLNPYSKDPWNLNVLPFHEESLFRHIKGDISGMTVPWLYVGMCFSTFCWHNEDHYAYSANYQHFGATKTWYGIPGSHAHAFEQAMKEAVPELFETQPDLLFQLVTLLPPEQLRKAGVDVYALDQRAGQFVITYPQAYHAGFNHGFNFNEAVNFAPADWEPFGEAGVGRLQEFRRQPCFSHDELLLTAASSDSTIKTARWLAPALERMREKELYLRERIVSSHKEISQHEYCNFDRFFGESNEQCGLTVKLQKEYLEEEDYQCYYCKAYTYLSQFRCGHTNRVSCLVHYDTVDCCAETQQQRLQGGKHSLILRHINKDLEALVQKVVDKAGIPEVWQAKVENLLENDARPSLKAMHTLVTEGEKIPWQLAGLDDLVDFVKKCDLWVEEANLYLVRKQQNRRKNEKVWRRQSTKGSKLDEGDVEPQLTLERMKELIDDGEKLGFSAPQLENLQEKLAEVDDWRTKVRVILTGRPSSTDELEVLLEEGRGFLAGMPEMTELEARHRETKWFEDVQAARSNLQNQSLEDCRLLLQRASEIGIRSESPDVMYLHDLVRQGDFWEIKVKEVMAADDVHYPQLESLHAQVQAHTFPVNQKTLADMDVILTKNREAKRQIITLVERCHDEDFRKRPMYIEVRDIMKALEDLNGKPHGTADLERELKRHEDWMRKGKKLFGKANAPLHILEQHMKIVEERNNFCFDLNDTFRPPVEPASREATPSDAMEKGALGEDEKPVFCLCRQPEAGLMIECEVCHDWYHAKCLKLARGKVKEYDMFTCPICDWRVKIPRDAARPKLEDLQTWQEEMPDLPFQPEEEDLLNRIVDKAQAFRDFLMQYIQGNQICQTADEMPTILFYLRKIEGADVLLAFETNMFRQELHKWQPIAPHPPPIIEHSSSTRKPRPTKQQKLMKEMGVEKIEDLPPHLRTKQYVRRKTTESYPTGPLRPKPFHQSSPMSGGPRDRSDTPLGVQRQGSSGTQPMNGHGHSQYPEPDGNMQMSGSTTFGHVFSTSGPSPYQARTPSPMFSPSASGPPNGLRDPMVSAFTGGSSNPGGGGAHGFGMFQGAVGLALGGDVEDIRSGLALGDSIEDTIIEHAQETMSSPPAGDYDGIFADMTNPDTQGDVGGATTLENQTSEASEALAMIDAEGASNTADGVDNEQERGTEGNEFVDILAGDDEQT